MSKGRGIDLSLGVWLMVSITLDSQYCKGVYELCIMIHYVIYNLSIKFW